METINKSIESINKKPIHVRRQTALFIVTSIIAVIFIIWLSTLSIAKNISKSESEENVASPFAVLKDNIVTLYASATDGLKEANK
jgi:hypothetical protein